MVATLLTSPTGCAMATAAGASSSHHAAVCPIAGAARKTMDVLRCAAVTGQRGGMRGKWPGRPGCSPASHQTSDAWPSRGDRRLGGAPVRSAAFRGRAEWEAGSETSARRAPVIPGPQEGAVAGAAARCCKWPRPPDQAAGVRAAAGPQASLAARAKGRSGSPSPARGSWRGCAAAVRPWRWESSKPQSVVARRTGRSGIAGRPIRHDRAGPFGRLRLCRQPQAWQP